MGDNNLSFKFIAKRDFDTVKAKYSYFEISKEKVESIIAKADPLDVLALTITPGSGLKIHFPKALHKCLPGFADYFFLLKSLLL